MTALELARFALYADLGVGFGVPAAAVLTQANSRIPALRPLLAGAAFVGLPLVVIVYLLVVAEMAGTGLAGLDWQLAGALAISTPIGWAFFVRFAALGVALALYLCAPGRISWPLAASAVALASLAWSGHGAAGEGAAGSLRLAGDIVHLLTAAIWLGALVLFLALLRRSSTTSPDETLAWKRFASIGSVLVIVLAVTGLANLWFLATPDTWSTLAASDYGQLLGAKFVLFLAMLALAGLNRFALVPRLTTSADSRERGRAIRALKLSIAAEFCAALAILLVVSRLGLLDPGMS